MGAKNEGERGHSYNINSAYLSRDVLNIGAGVAGKPQGRGAFFNDEQVATVRTEKIHRHINTCKWT